MDNNVIIQSKVVNCAKKATIIAINNNSDKNVYTYDYKKMTAYLSSKQDTLQPIENTSYINKLDTIIFNTWPFSIVRLRPGESLKLKLNESQIGYSKYIKYSIYRPQEQKRIDMVYREFIDSAKIYFVPIPPTSPSLRQK